MLKTKNNLIFFKIMYYDNNILLNNNYVKNNIRIRWTI
jgi:hypothetical protein